MIESATEADANRNGLWQRYRYIRQFKQQEYAYKSPQYPKQYHTDLHTAWTFSNEQ